MATGGVGEQSCDSLGSEDICDLKCQPCQVDGELQEAIGMCIDCQEYLCQRCYDIHTIPTPMRSHKLLDKQQMLQRPISATVKDRCTEKCEQHEDETIKYNCKSHCHLGCSVCITLDHRECKGVKYIPHAAKDLANCEEYQQTASQLKSLLEKSKEIYNSANQAADSIDDSYVEAFELLQGYRKDINEVLDKIETQMVENMKALKSKMMKKMASLTEKWKQMQEDMARILANIEDLAKKGHNCSSYTVMMKTKGRLQTLEDEVTDFDKEKPFNAFQFKFTPNRDVLKSLDHPDVLGTMSSSRRIVTAEHVRDIPVKTGSDTSECFKTGSVCLSDDTLVITDYDNKSIKAVDVTRGQVTTELKMLSAPWCITITRDNQVAVTLPDQKQIAFATAGSTNISVDRMLDVDGACKGVDYRDGKLAVSFCSPYKVQIIDLQGTVLHTITDNQGISIFGSPSYVAFGRDSTLLYVSNTFSHNVVCIKPDGTVVATYTDSELKQPRKALVHSSGEVYVCSHSSDTVHQISPDCKKIKVLLSRADSLKQPYSICNSDTDNKFYIGMYSCDHVKVYKFAWEFE